MPPIGRYVYPAYGPKIIIESLEKIRDSRVTSVKGVAQVLGHKTENSGGFLSKLAAMSKYYGVIERHGKAIEFTQLGKEIAYPATEDEKSDAVTEMILRVQLIKDLYERLGDTYDRDQFFIHLCEVSGADREVAVRESGKIRNIYDEALLYLKKKPPVSRVISVSKGEKKMEATSTPSEVTLNVGQGMIRLEIFGKPPILVPDKKHYIQSLIQDLEEHMKETPRESCKKESKEE